MGSKLEIERMLSAARAAAANESWQEAAEAAAAAAANWPEPGGWPARIWRRWRVGALLAALDLEARPWRDRAGEACVAKARAQLRLCNDDPDAEASIAAIERLAINARRWGHAETGALNEATAAWRVRATTYEAALRQGEEAMGALRYRAAVEAFEAARAAFATAVAGSGLAAAQVGAEREGAFIEGRARADVDIANGHYACAVARLASACAGFAREDGAPHLEAARNALAGRDACLEAAQALQAGELGRAERAFEAAAEARWSLSTGVGAPEARWWQAAMAMQRGAPERALRCLEDMKGGEAAYRRGLALAALGRYVAAEEAFEDGAWPEAAEAARQAAARRTCLMERAIGEKLAQEDIKAAIALAEAHLAVEDDEVIRSLRDGHLVPRQLESWWRNASPAQRVLDAAEQFRRTPDPTTLHTWLVALDALALVEDAHVADWLIATGAVLADLAASPAFDMPHRAWTPAEREAIAGKLRDRVEQRLDAARDAAPERERVWRDAWRMELVALELSRSGRQLPRLGGIAVTPGLWRFLMQPTDVRPPHGQTFDDQLFAALYSNWGPVVAAWRAGNMARAHALRPTASDPRAGTGFGGRLLDIELGLAKLAEGDVTGFNLLELAKEMLKSRREWLEALDAVGERQLEALGPDRARAYARRWHEAVDGPAARRWHVTLEAEALREQLANDKIAAKKAAEQLEALLRIDPGNPMALKLRQLQADQQVLKDVQAAMRQERFEAAVAIARSKGSPEVRAMVADFCMKILDENFNRGMSAQEAQFLIRSARDLVPDNNNYRELAQKMGVWG